MYLKGFDQELVNKYLEKRFHDKPAAMSRAKNYVDAIRQSSTITPLIIRLLCDLAADNQNESRQLPDCKYLKKENPLDNTIIQLMDREIDKQSLEIDCDEYFDILKDVVFEYHGSATKEQFSELIEITLASRPRETKQKNFDNFFLSMLLKKDAISEHFSIKYDALILLIKGRYISYCINNCIGENNMNILNTLAYECYRVVLSCEKFASTKKKILF